MASGIDGIQRSSEKAQMRMHEAVNKTMKEFNLMLRPFLKQSFQCQIACCDNTGLMDERFDSCLQQCLAPVQAIQQTLNYETMAMQDRYVRCHHACEDEMKDLMHTYRLSDGSPDMARIEPKIVACMEACTTKHIDLLPQMMDRLKQSVPP
mmetsp:Transcript_6562/g.16835  ORF Transcript_6562/g.16835 Transcript_6562/m.16835 type:complete len:151 (+) Transcript_6562:128-580(+)